MNSPDSNQNAPIPEASSERFNEDWLATIVGLAILGLALLGLIPKGVIW